MTRHKHRAHIRQFLPNNDPLIGYCGELYFPLGTFPLHDEIPHMTFDGRPYVAASMILRFCRAANMQQQVEKYTAIVAGYKPLTDRSLELMGTPQRWCTISPKFEETPR